MDLCTGGSQQSDVGGASGFSGDKLCGERVEAVKKAMAKSKRSLERGYVGVNDLGDVAVRRGCRIATSALAFLGDLYCGGIDCETLMKIIIRNGSEFNRLNYLENTSASLEK